MRRTQHLREYFRTVLWITVVLGAATAAYPAEPDSVLHVEGEVPKPSDWTVKRLREELALQIKPVQFTSRGKQHTANCLPLLSVLKAAGVQTELKMDPKADPKVKNAEVRLVVLVEGSDGYGAAFSLAELLPEVGNRQVWLALDLDGEPLTGRDGPTRLIVPDDQKPARWIRNVAVIHVTRLGN
jgi:DMSO/TMAO reductase YedYZ molybdopterin-dependent catalytic subunit